MTTILSHGRPFKPSPPRFFTSETLREWHQKYIEQSIPNIVQSQSQEQLIKELECDLRSLDGTVAVDLGENIWPKTTVSRMKNG